MMHFLHDAEIAHLTPGRIRLRVGARHGDALFFIEAGRQLAELPGVTGVSTNRHSQSITIRHDGTLRLELISGALAAAAAAPSVQVPTAESDYSEALPMVRGRSGQVVSALVQLAVAAMFGRALAHVLELLAGNLIQAAAREIAPALKRQFATA
ncbi:MAG: hypothetical protein KGO48_18825 [Alphaproteobacteria bacterium]|nr:hypothetical protein [Alphaproteobacteria bacterium]